MTRMVWTQDGFVRFCGRAAHANQSAETSSPSRISSTSVVCTIKCSKATGSSCCIQCTQARQLRKYQVRRSKVEGPDMIGTSSAINSVCTPSALYWGSAPGSCTKTSDLPSMLGATWTMLGGCVRGAPHNWTCVITSFGNCILQLQKLCPSHCRAVEATLRIPQTTSKMSLTDGHPIDPL